jgi:hypothetical protein
MTNKSMRATYALIEGELMARHMLAHGVHSYYINPRVPLNFERDLPLLPDWQQSVEYEDFDLRLDAAY